MERAYELGLADGAAHPELVTIGAGILRSPTQRVESPSSAYIEQLCEKLVFLLGEINGAGLAANQIGVPLRVMVFQVRKTELFPDRPETPLYVMINPDILERSQETEDTFEGCFSVPGYTGMVPRASFLTCRYWTPDGVEHVEKFEHFTARVIQHECDHLDGFVYLDRMRSMRDLITQPNYRHFHLAHKQGENDGGSAE